MEWVFKTGLIPQNISVSGKMIKRMARAKCFMRMEISMKGNGLRTKRMVRENMTDKMEQFLKVVGNMTNNMALVARNGLMELFMREILKTVRKKVKGN